MSLTCVECATVNADGDAFCTGCGVSLALAISSNAVAAVGGTAALGAMSEVRGMTTPVAAVPRNAFPEEPGRVSGGSHTLPWLLVAALVLALGAAVVGSGRWAFQRMSAPDGPVPVTIVEPADLSGEHETRDAAMDATMDAATDAVMDAASEVPMDIAEPAVQTLVDPGPAVQVRPPQRQLAPPPVITRPRPRAELPEPPRVSSWPTNRAANDAGYEAPPSQR